ncbi:hypothetical protein SUDANB38_00007 [Streptomyces sp. enrichment culture]
MYYSGFRAAHFLVPLAQLTRFPPPGRCARADRAGAGLLVGLVDLDPALRDPGGEGGIHLLDGGKRPPSQDVVCPMVHC